LSEITGVSRKTIRYYEQVGILPPPKRSDSRYRLYSETDVRRVELIRRAQLLDMSLPEVRELVERASNVTCNDFQDSFLKVIRLKLEEVDKRIADLHHLKADLERLEAHLNEAGKEEVADHTMLECYPETCTCLGRTPANTEHRQEVTLWLNKSKSKRSPGKRGSRTAGVDAEALSAGLHARK
jgi:DNA-binding transcriptional MerR regulator